MQKVRDCSTVTPTLATHTLAAHTHWKLHLGRGFSAQGAYTSVSVLLVAATIISSQYM
jgi:hypothetical protein